MSLSLVPKKLSFKSRAFSAVPSAFFFCGALGKPFLSLGLCPFACKGFATEAMLPALVAPAVADSLVIPHESVRSHDIADKDLSVWDGPASD